MKKIIVVLLLLLVVQSIWASETKNGLVFNPFNDQERAYYGGISKIDNFMLEAMFGFSKVSHII